MGQALINYAKPYVTSPEPINSNPIVSAQIVSLPIDTNPVVSAPVESEVTSVQPTDTNPIVSPPIDTNPVVSAPVESEVSSPVAIAANPIVSLPINTNPIVSAPVESEVSSPQSIDANPIVSPPIDTNPVVSAPVDSEVTSPQPIDTNPIVSPPIETNPVITPAVNSAPVSFDFPASNQPLVGIIDTGFSANNPDIDYSRIILGRDRISNDDNPLLQPGEGNEHGTAVLGIIGATQNNGIGIDGVNDKAPIWVGRAVDSGKWAESLVEFVDAAKASNPPNAVVNLSLDLTQTNPDGSVTTRYELTPQERAAIEYARQNKVVIIVAASRSVDALLGSEPVVVSRVFLAHQKERFLSTSFTGLAL
jgi:hypothetical protein